MRGVGADDRGPEFFPVVHGDFHLAGVGNHVVVGENVPFLIDHEAGALALLRDQAVEEVEGNGLRGDIDDGGNILAVDEDVVLLFGVERFGARRLGDFHLVRTGDPLGEPEGRGSPGSEVKESGSQQDRQKQRPQKLHRLPSAFRSMRIKSLF